MTPRQNWDHGTADEKLDRRRHAGPGLEVRMYDRETVELALYALDA